MFVKPIPSKYGSMLLLCNMILLTLLNNRFDNFRKYHSSVEKFSLSLSTFYFIYTTKCAQEAEYGTIKSSTLIITQQYLMQSQN